jgi:hypothetical protein
MMAAYRTGSGLKSKKSTSTNGASWANATLRYALLNINNLTTWMRNDGQSNHSPRGADGAHFPRGTANVIYQDGMMWGGIPSLDAAKTKRPPRLFRFQIGGSNYQTGTRAGGIVGWGADAGNAG